jgi:penicillin-binding protein 1A
MTLFRAVTAHGTGAAVAQLSHPLGGKTGTTSDYTDAWFLGFSPSVTCGVWVGFDSRQSLGEKETGARAALPIWMQIMKVAISGKDDEQFPGDVEDPSVQKALLTQPAKPSAPQTPLPTRPQSSSPTSATSKPVPLQAPAHLSRNVSSPAARPIAASTPVRPFIPATKPALTPAPKSQQPGPRTPTVH